MQYYTLQTTNPLSQWLEIKLNQMAIYGKVYHLTKLNLLPNFLCISVLWRLCGWILFKYNWGGTKMWNYQGVGNVKQREYGKSWSGMIACEQTHFDIRLYPDTTCITATVTLRGSFDSNLAVYLCLFILSVRATCYLSATCNVYWILFDKNKNLFDNPQNPLF